jgi:hypothetical protein
MRMHQRRQRSFVTEQKDFRIRSLFHEQGNAVNDHARRVIPAHSIN